MRSSRGQINNFKMPWFSVKFLAVILAVSAVIVEGSSSNEDGAGSSSSETIKSSNPHSSNPLSLSLKHRRYKSIRDNSTENSPPRTIIPSPTSIHPEHALPHNPILIDPHTKTSRGGLGGPGGFEIQKSPPDLQFGLAFTVPFVSLSTEKLLHGVAGGKGFDGNGGWGGGNGVSSLFKLNFSGLFLAAVVGIIAILGIFVPTLLGPGGILGGHGGGWGGWGNGILDGILPSHFTENLYNDYEGGWGGPNKHNNGWGKEFNNHGKRFSDGGVGDGGARRAGRANIAIKNVLLKSFESVRSGVGNVEECVVARVCEEQKLKKMKRSGKSASGEGGESLLIGLVNEIEEGFFTGNNGTDPEFIKSLRRIAGGDLGACEGKKSEQLRSRCDVFNSVSDVVGDVWKGVWGSWDNKKEGGGSSGEGGGGGRGGENSNNNNKRGTNSKRGTREL